MCSCDARTPASPSTLCVLDRRSVIRVNARTRLQLHAERVRGSADDGEGSRFVIPKTAKGKLLTVKVKITATDSESGTTMTATKIATFRVR